MINRAIIVGRVGQDPKTFESKTKIVSFSVATDQGFGENKTTIWENIKVFGKTAEACEKYVRRGMLVYVQGRREQQAGKDGKVYMNVVADDVKFLSKVDGEPVKPKRLEGRIDAGSYPQDDDDGIPL